LSCREKMSVAHILDRYWLNSKGFLIRSGQGVKVLGPTES